MKTCRACLLTESDMYPLNEYFVTNFNLLTNLTVDLCDGFPQYLCRGCIKAINFFVEFRSRAITSDTSLKELIEDKKPDLTALQFVEEAAVTTEPSQFEDEVKIENDSVCDFITYEQISQQFDDFDSNDDNNELSEVKDKQVVTGRKRRLKNTNTEKRSSKRIKLKSEESLFSNKIKDVLEVDLKKKKKKAEKSFSCGLCKKMFNVYDDLKSHLEIHKKPQRCELCSENFNSWQHLYAHRITHLPEKDRRCHICDRRYNKCFTLEYHYWKKHSDEQEISIKCIHCPKAFNTALKVRKHIFNCHNIKFFCDYCSKECKSKAGLKKHIDHHLNAKAYKCHLCEYTSNYQNNLKEHFLRKHSSDKVTCNKCRRVFKNQQDCDKHTCVVRHYVCPICGKEIFSREIRQLKRHLKTHDPVARYKCSRCSKSYRSKEALIVHNNRHDDVRPYQCDYCPYRFFSRVSRMKHHRTHTGKKPYVCNVCGRAFTGNSNLKVHMKVHGQFLIKHRNTESEKDKITK